MDYTQAVSVPSRLPGILFAPLPCLRQPQESTPWQLPALGARILVLGAPAARPPWLPGLPGHKSLETQVKRSWGITLSGPIYFSKCGSQELLPSPLFHLYRMQTDGAGGDNPDGMGVERGTVVGKADTSILEPLIIGSKDQNEGRVRNWVTSEKPLFLA